jgi:hypothetical protein
VADIDPKIAKLLRMMGASDKERRIAFAALECEMQSEGVSWSDIGNAYQRFANGNGGDAVTAGQYSKAEMHEFAQAARAEGVEAGIKIGAARAHQSNGHLILPSPSGIAEHCHQRLSKLKDDKERAFVNDMYLMTRHGRTLSMRRLGYLVSLYIQIGGSTE